MRLLKIPGSDRQSWEKNGHKLEQTGCHEEVDPECKATDATQALVQSALEKQQWFVTRGVFGRLKNRVR